MIVQDIYRWIAEKYKTALSKLTRKEEDILPPINLDLDLDSLRAAKEELRSRTRHIPEVTGLGIRPPGHLTLYLSKGTNHPLPTEVNGYMVEIRIVGKIIAF